MAKSKREEPGEPREHNWTRQRTFRLTDEDLDRLAYLAAKWGRLYVPLNRTQVVKACIAYVYDLEKNSEKSV